RPIAALTINHQGQFPAVTLSFNLAQGVSLGQATTAIDEAMRALGTPAALAGSFQGTAQAFQQSLASEPYLIAAALVAVYIILGVLYESTIHPLTRQVAVAIAQHQLLIARQLLKHRRQPVQLAIEGGGGQRPAFAEIAAPFDRQPAAQQHHGPLRRSAGKGHGPASAGTGATDRI
ncbi:efflux RND transporter permease subunit, partial [Azospirillum sp. B506]|uniref:efflux RND transporter permease subunit n=1 Tax=Azospirillum sp. B506 TaxID=137721 RepID=UPI0005B2B54A